MVLRLSRLQEQQWQGTTIFQAWEDPPTMSYTTLATGCVQFKHHLTRLYLIYTRTILITTTFSNQLIQPARQVPWTQDHLYSQVSNRTQVQSLFYRNMLKLEWELTLWWRRLRKFLMLQLILLKMIFRATRKGSNKRRLIKGQRLKCPILVVIDEILKKMILRLLRFI